MRRGKPPGKWRTVVRRSLVAFPAPTPQSTPCRLWQGPVNKGGYGVRPEEGGGLIHRWVWEQVNGPLLAHERVLHRCDHPPCFRYDHLFVGTQADNVADMIAKGRARKRGQPGMKNGVAKFTDEQVAEMRSAVARGERRYDVAGRYGISYVYLCGLVRGERRK